MRVEPVHAQLGHIGQVGAKILATRFAVVLRVGNVQFAWASGDQVTHIMQGACEHPVAACGFVAVWTGALRFIARFFDNLGLGQVFDPCEHRIGLVLAGAQFR